MGTLQLDAVERADYVVGGLVYMLRDMDNERSGPVHQIIHGYEACRAEYPDRIPALTETQRETILFESLCLAGFYSTTLFPVVVRRRGGAEPDLAERSTFTRRVCARLEEWFQAQEGLRPDPWERLER